MFYNHHHHHNINNNRRIISHSNTQLSKSFSEITQSQSNFLILSPFRISPALLDKKDVIFDKNRRYFDLNLIHELNSNSSNSNTISSERSIIHEIKQYLTKDIMKNFKPLSRVERNRKNVIIDPHYDYHRYENSLMRMLMSSKHESEALAVLTQLWRDMMFCDLILIVHNKQFLAHRVVLALYSRKYRNYFNQHKDEFVTRINLLETSTKGMYQVLHFLYTNQISITIKTIDAVLTCAKELDITKLKTMCADCLSRFDKKYVFQVLEISRNHRLNIPFYHFYQYLCLNFNECIKLNTFMQVTYELLLKLLELLDDEEIDDRNETLLFYRLATWITTNHNQVRKKGYRVSILLKKINFKQISSKNYNKILMENKLLLDIDSCHQIIIDGLAATQNYHGNIMLKRRTHSLDTPRNKHRNSTSPIKTHLL